jgi:hypothetical protein
MRQLLWGFGIGAFVIVTTLGLWAWLDPVFGNSFKQEFLPSFWPNLAAELIVGVGIVYGLNWVIERSRNIDAEILLEIVELDNGFRRLTFWITSTGDVAFRAQEMYWNLFVPEEVPIAGLHPFNRNTTITSDGIAIAIVSQQRFQYISGMVTAPVFNGSNVSLFYTDIPPGVALPARTAFYALSTVYGQVPRNVQRDTNGQPILQSLRLVGVFPRPRYAKRWK